MCQSISGLRPAALLKTVTLAQVFSCEFCEVFNNTFLRNIFFLKGFQISSFWGQGQNQQNYQINISCFRVTSEPKNRHHIEPELFPKNHEILVKNTLFSDRQLVLRIFCPTPHTTLLFFLYKVKDLMEVPARSLIGQMKNFQEKSPTNEVKLWKNLDLSCLTQ